MHNIGSFETNTQSEKVFNNPLFKGAKNENKPEEIGITTNESPYPNSNTKVSIKSITRNSLEGMKLSITTNDSDFVDNRTSRSKSDSISTQRNSVLSLHNESEHSYSKLLDGSETASIERSLAHSSTSRAQKPKDEGNILNGFLFLVNKASNFWANKFTKNESNPIKEETKEDFEYETQEKQNSIVNENNSNPPQKNNEEMNLCIETQKLRICSNTDSIDDATSEKFSSEIIKEENSNLESKLKKKISKCSVESTPDWKKLAKEFSSPSMSPNVLKEKFKNIKDSMPPKKTRFTHSEDIIIVKYYRKHGSNWEAISKYLPERTPSMIKNRFYSSIKKKNMLSKLISEVEEEEGLTQENKNSVISNSNPISLLAPTKPTIWNNPLNGMGQIKIEKKPSQNDSKQPENLYSDNHIDYYSLTTRDANINQHHPILCENQTNWPVNLNLFHPYAFENPFENELQYKIADSKNNIIRNISQENDGNFMDVFHGSHILDPHHDKMEEFEIKFHDFEDSKPFTFHQNIPDHSFGEMSKVELQLSQGIFNQPMDVPVYKLENQCENEYIRSNNEPPVETEEKINLLKNRISSIQNLFFETKSELEKLQKCFNQ